MQSPSSQSEATLHAVDYWQVIKNRYGVILMTLLLVFMTAAVITYVMPKKFLSTAVVQVKPSNRVGVALGNEHAGTSIMTPQFFATEFEVIRSQLTLKYVVQRLSLMTRWNMTEEEALGTLRGIVDAQNIRGTDLIQISVKHTGAEDARDVAKEVYEAYKKRREEKERMIAEEGMKELEKAVLDQSDVVEEKRKQRDNLLRRAPAMIRDSITGVNGANGIQGLQTMLESQVEASTTLLAEIDSTIKTIDTLNADEVIRYAANLESAGQDLKSLYPEYQSQERLLSGLQKNGLGPNHPNVLSQKGTVDSLHKQLQASVVSFKESLRLKRETKAIELEDLKKRLTEVKEVAVNNVILMTNIQGVQKEFETQQEMLDRMREKLSMDRINLKQPQNIIELHEEPLVAQFPSSPNVSLNLILGAVVGLIFGIGIAFFLEYLDTSVKTLEDVERYLQIPVLAVIPKEVGVLHKQSGMSPDAEAYRILRTNIEFNRKNPEDNAITVVSGGAGEGKSTTLVNLAYICAQGGYTTLMIDADLRRPRLHTFFDINNSVGLTNYLTTELMLEDVILQTPVDNLYFMPSGVLPADAAGILNSRRMSELIQDVKQRFDLILVDSPPILGVSDASVLASEVDLTIIVVQHRKLPRNMLMRVKQSVENVGGNVIGVVLNNVDVRSDSQYQYYTSYYTYYAPAESQVSAPQRLSAPRAPESATSGSTDDSLY
ncbi:MAG: polysaccharide biosynthesis tyrosine autokinase [Verrucomicrobia bacterium]|nr:MAG: polysaccharide biosynthesis tyrosine autokinase [Verrucomicrobiota bacterium]